MGCLRLIFVLLLPPLAVLDKGIGPVVITTILTILGWVPGVLAALIFIVGEDDRPRRRYR